jgi:hypothetical protein
MNVTKVDYFSLDVEGSEMDVLRTIPFDEIDITVRWTKQLYLENTHHNERVSDKPRRLPRHQRAQAHNSTHYRRQLSFMYWLCCKQNCLLCAYEHDFGDNYIITII